MQTNPIDHPPRSGGTAGFRRRLPVREGDGRRVLFRTEDDAVDGLFRRSGRGVARAVPSDRKVPRRRHIRNDVRVSDFRVEHIVQMLVLRLEEVVVVHGHERQAVELAGREARRRLRQAVGLRGALREQRHHVAKAFFTADPPLVLVAAVARNCLVDNGFRLRRLHVPMLEAFLEIAVLQMAGDVFEAIFFRQRFRLAFDAVVPHEFSNPPHDLLVRMPDAVAAHAVEADHARIRRKDVEETVEDHLDVRRGIVVDAPAFRRRVAAHEHHEPFRRVRRHPPRDVQMDGYAFQIFLHLFFRPLRADVGLQEDFPFAARDVRTGGKQILLDARIVGLFGNPAVTPCIDALFEIRQLPEGLACRKHR